MGVAGSAGCGLLPGVRKQHPLVTLLLRWVINALGIMLAAWLIPGIKYQENNALVIVVVLLGLFNAFLKPMIVLFALPFVVMTLGFGVLFINAGLFLLAARLVKGFEVSSFFAAFLGALIVSILNLVLGRALGDDSFQNRLRRAKRAGSPRGPRSGGGGGDVIDV